MKDGETMTENMLEKTMTITYSRWNKFKSKYPSKDLEGANVKEINDKYVLISLTRLGSLLKTGFML